MSGILSANIILHLLLTQARDSMQWLEDHTNVCITWAGSKGNVWLV